MRAARGIPAPLPYLNRNRFPGCADIVSKVLADPTLMRMLSRILDEDIDFYRRFL